MYDLKYLSNFVVCGLFIYSKYCNEIFSLKIFFWIFLIEMILEEFYFFRNWMMLGSQGGNPMSRSYALTNVCWTSFFTLVFSFFVTNIYIVYKELVIKHFLLWRVIFPIILAIVSLIIVVYVFYFLFLGGLEDLMEYIAFVFIGSIELTRMNFNYEIDNVIESFFNESIYSYNYSSDNNYKYSKNSTKKELQKIFNEEDFIKFLEKIKEDNIFLLSDRAYFVLNDVFRRD